MLTKTKVYKVSMMEQKAIYSKDQSLNLSAVLLLKANYKLINREYE